MTTLNVTIVAATVVTMKLTVFQVLYPKGDGGL